MKEVILGIVGAVGSAIASFFGGWDAGLTTLLIFMAVDYLSGLIVAGVFTSPTRLTLVHWKARHVGRVFAGSA